MQGEDRRGRERKHNRAARGVAIKGDAGREQRKEEEENETEKAGQAEHAEACKTVVEQH